MTDLYRRLLSTLTEHFGGTLDDANADAIAYAAAELYHRDFEPRLWQEKSAHDLLDLFGIPREGVFAPYSLSDRLILFQRRSSQADYLARAHELLDTLGVPRQDADGTEMTIKWRLDQVVASANGALEPGGEPEESAAGNAASDAAGDAAGKEESVTPETEAGEHSVADNGLVDSTSPDEPAGVGTGTGTGTGKAADNGQAGEGGGEGAVAGAEVAEDATPSDAEATADGQVQPATATAGGDEPEVEAAGAADDEAGATESEEEPATVSGGLSATTGDSSDEAPAEPHFEVSPSQLVEAIRVVEQAAKVEQEAATANGVGTAGVDVVSLTETLNGIQGEIAAVRELVEAFEIGLRRQLDELQAQVKVAVQPRPPAAAGTDGRATPPPPTTVVRRPSIEPTRRMPLPDRGAEPSDWVGDGVGEGMAVSVGMGDDIVSERRSSRRILLLVLIVALGLLLAGGVLLMTTVGWESLSSQLVD